MGIETAIAIGAVAAGASIYQAKKSADAQEKSAAQAAKTAAETADQADQAYNKANAKTPDVSSLLAANSKKSGISSTMLTGSSGASTNNLTLGKSTLLGG